MAKCPRIGDLKGIQPVSAGSRILVRIHPGTSKTQRKRLAASINRMMDTEVCVLFADPVSVTMLIARWTGTTHAQPERLIGPEDSSVLKPEGGTIQVNCSEVELDNSDRIFVINHSLTAADFKKFLIDLRQWCGSTVEVVAP